jgi:hypothetical protein
MIRTLIFIILGLTTVNSVWGQANTRGKLTKIDFSDSNYVGVQIYAKDTTTSDGWRIKYLVKDDSTRYNDLYIQWTKGQLTGLFCLRDVLLMRRYFIPILKGNNKTHIFMKHGCATSCSAILTLSKDKKLESRDFAYVVDFDITTGQIVYIPERSYSLETLEVSVVDLNRHLETPVIFRNICNLAPESGCIDQILFAKDNVIVSASLLDKDDKTKSVKESHTVKFGE